MTRKADAAKGVAATELVEAAAAYWLARCDAGLNASERLAYETWRAADTRHAAEFDRIAASWRKLDQLVQVDALNVEAEQTVRRALARRAKKRMVRVYFGVLATAAVVAFAFLGWKQRGELGTTDYQIIPSVSHQVELADGSTALLNGDSRIESDYTDSERRVRLVAGEALFTVAKNPDRPFLVTAGAITVRAVGTAFNVKLAAKSIDVLVTEGTVRVYDHAQEKGSSPPSSEPRFDAAAPDLTAGHRLRVDLEAEPASAHRIEFAPVASFEMEQALAWRSVRLVFNDTPLDEVIVAFNRHNTHRMRIGDDILRARKITGVFQADNLDGFTRLLEAGLDVTAEASGAEETVLRPAR